MKHSKRSVVAVSEVERSCRTCRHFIRVYEERFKDNIRKRGFCTYGLGEADFSLYVSSTHARECPFFEPDEEAIEIFELERRLVKEWEKKKGKYWDGRTRTGRLIRKRYEEKYKGAFAGLLMAEREVLGELYEEFVREHESEMEVLKNACKMTLDEYKALIFSMTRKAEFIANGPDFTALEAPKGIILRMEEEPVEVKARV